MILPPIQKMRKSFARRKSQPKEKEREAKSNSGNAAKKFKSTSDSQLFHGKVFYLFTL